MAAAHAALPPARSPADSLKAIHVRSNLVVELVAAEPLVADPVAVDWDARGRLWVVEQPDYPQGMDGNWKPGGRVKILTDADGDGRMDRASLFLDGLPWPTGITCWRSGVLICAAPDILYAEDTNGDGKADVVKKLFTGFATDNFNARINSLALGLDGWLHGASGNRPGKIRSELTGTVTDISGRDVRLHPDTGAFETIAGATQHGRARNDWDDWFGCSNSRWIFQFPFPEHYAQRNPHVSAPASSVTIYDPADNALNAVSPMLDRWNNPRSLGHVTAAGGLGIYRDDLLGAEFTGNAFIGDAAHNLVRRFVLEPNGVTFRARRPRDEARTEFFASEDNWTRPVQVRTGPDGALYVVDMYRAVIEHTRWIPADKLKGLDVRAGDTMGRIYRVRPRDAKLRTPPDLTKLDAGQLAAALDTPNGTVRDLVHLQLLHRGDASKPAFELLTKLAESSGLPAVRVQALAILEGFKGLKPATLRSALSDADPHVRRHAARLAELRMASTPALAAPVLRLANDSEFVVRHQSALALGALDDARAVDALASIAARDSESEWTRAAVLSSSTSRPMAIHGALSKSGVAGAGVNVLLGDLIGTAAAQFTTSGELGSLLLTVAGSPETPPQAWQFSGLAHVLDAMDRRRLPLDATPNADAAARLFAVAREIASSPSSTDAERGRVLPLIGRSGREVESDAAVLAGFLTPGTGAALQKKALNALARLRLPQTPDLLLTNWSEHGASAKQGIVNTLSSRPEWASRLLDAVAAGSVAVGEVPVANRAALSSHPDAAIRARAVKLFPQGTGDRAALVSRYRTVEALTGDGARGATVFEANCASCHAYLGRGFELGPNLSAYRTKATGDFLAAILDPNSAMDARFTVYNIETRDGRELTGILTSETATSVTLAQAGGVSETLLRADVASMRVSPLSLMPEGLEAVLSPQDIADLIAFVRGAE